MLVKDDPNPNIYNTSSWNVEDDAGIVMITAGFSGLLIVPTGFCSMLEYLKNTYNNPPIYIQENVQLLPRDGMWNDPSRVEYLDAIRNGSNIRGCMTWTMLDCFELMGGYYFGYGFCYVDFDNELKRYEKFFSKMASPDRPGPESIDQ